jgi:hypothetical protein
MAQEEKTDRKPPGSLTKGMSLYASSADYERRLSEDCAQALEADVVDQIQAAAVRIGEDPDRGANGYR